MRLNFIRKHKFIPLISSIFRSTYVYFSEFCRTVLFIAQRKTVSFDNLSYFCTLNLGLTFICLKQRKILF